MTPEQLSAAVGSCVQDAVRDGELGVDAHAAVPERFTVTRPRHPEHGDYTTTAALQLAQHAGRAPREIAELLAVRLRAVPGIAGVDVAGPGFVNITLAPGEAGELARTIVTAGPAYGLGTALAGVRVDLEFISANPTGPLHLGHARWAAVGDALARILTAAGAEVTREFYINDRGVQMDRFGASLRAAALGEPVPADGYHGEYVGEMAREILAEDPGILALDPGASIVAFREEGYRRQLTNQRSELEAFGVHFDVWYSERELYTSGAVERGLARLHQAGHVYQSDGATWLRTTDFGDDKDRVLVRSDGESTYFASDTAYYVDKRSRGFDVCLYLLGADHHGYVGRLRAAAACAGDDPDRTLQVLIGQLVSLVQGGEPVRMSKRAGTIITLADLVEWVGADAARYALTRSSTDSPLTLDVDVLTARTNDNPVYYVQYAHARIASVLRHAQELDLEAGELVATLLVHPREADLLRALGEFPRVVASAAELREPHRVARYLEELAGVYHRFYDACRVLPRGDEPVTDRHRARLWVCAATRTVLANGLGLLGVDAPERM
ncbi:MAG: arginine--tRNA ligase [Actinomycetes bacterium]